MQLWRPLDGQRRGRAVQRLLLLQVQDARRHHEHHASRERDGDVAQCDQAESQDDELAPVQGAECSEQAGDGEQREEREPEALRQQPVDHEPVQRERHDLARQDGVLQVELLDHRDEQGELKREQRETGEAGAVAEAGGQMVRHRPAAELDKPFRHRDVDDEISEQRGADLDRLDVRKVVREHVYGCFIDESSGLRCLDLIGDDNIMMETDFPHSDTTWPNSITVARKLLAHLPPETQYKILQSREVLHRTAETLDLPNNVDYANRKSPPLARLIGWLRERLPGARLSLHTNGQLALKKIDTFNLYNRVSLSLPSFDAPCWRALGKLELAAGQADSAAVTFERLVDLEEGDFRNWVLLGAARQNAGNFGQAEKALLQASRERYPREYGQLIRLYFQELSEGEE